MSFQMTLMGLLGLHVEKGCREMPGDQAQRLGPAGDVTSSRTLDFSPYYRKQTWKPSLALRITAFFLVVRVLPTEGRRLSSFLRPVS